MVGIVEQIFKINLLRNGKDAGQPKSFNILFPCENLINKPFSSNNFQLIKILEYFTWELLHQLGRRIFVKFLLVYEGIRLSLILSEKSSSISFFFFLYRSIFFFEPWVQSTQATVPNSWKRRNILLTLGNFLSAIKSSK